MIDKRWVAFIGWVSDMGYSYRLSRPRNQYNRMYYDYYLQLYIGMREIAVRASSLDAILDELKGRLVR